MKKLLVVVVLATLFIPQIQAQKYFTRNGNISFSSDAPLEKIEAVNKSVTSVVDTESGKIEFAVLIKAFQFEKALMQEHFNENYMESGKFPKAVFKGQIENIEDIDFSKDGTYAARVGGQMTIHGVTKEEKMEGTFEIKEGKIGATSQFILIVADYGIEVPKVVRDNIAKEVEVKVNLKYQSLK